MSTTNTKTRNDATYLHLPHLVLVGLIEHSIPVELTRAGYLVSGFYKSGTVLLEANYDMTTNQLINFTAAARYGERTQIDTWVDLVELNYRWWLNSGKTYSRSYWAAAHADLKLV